MSIQDVTPELAEKFELDDREGALVSEVSPDSPAEDAGLKSGDVILEFNGTPVENSRELKLTVAQTAPEKEVKVKISRDGDVKELEVTLKEFPADKALPKGTGDAASSEDVTDGITVEDLNTAARRQFNIPSRVEAALVLNVEPNSPGYEAGLRAGDVILEMNRQPVRSAQEAIELSEKEEMKNDVLLRIWSRGGSRYVVLQKSGQVG